MPDFLFQFADAEVAATGTGPRISGTVLPYGAASQPTMNGHRYRFSGPPANADELVELVREHEPDAVLGRLEAWDPRDDALGATVRTFNTTAGRDALVEASEGVRPGFSIGAHVAEGALSLADDGVYDVAAWTARHIGLVRRPSFTGATVSQVAASSAPTREDTTVPTDESTTTTDTPPAETSPTTVPPAGGATTTTTPPAVSDVVTVTAGAAQVPAERTGDTGSTLTFSQALDTVAQRVQATGPHNVLAALADIVPADDTGFGYLRPQWLDEVWTPVAITRDFIEAVNHQRLTTGTKVYGWKWDTYPTVDVYEGNKGPIPTSPAKTVPIEAPITRLAGGWDVDRIFVDLGAPGFLESFFRAATRDLAAKQEAAVATALVDAATVPADPAPADLWGAVDLAARALELNGANMTFVGISSDLWAEYVKTPRAEVPWWVPNGPAPSLRDSTGSAADVRFFANHTLPAGTVVAGDRNAVTFYEASPNPIRVQAVNIPNGGVDLAVFAYQALLVNDARGLVKVGPGQTPPPVEGQAAAVSARRASK